MSRVIRRETFTILGWSLTVMITVEASFLLGWHFDIYYSNKNPRYCLTSVIFFAHFSFIWSKLCKK